MHSFQTCFCLNKTLAQCFHNFDINPDDNENGLLHSDTDYENPRSNISSLNVNEVYLALKYLKNEETFGVDGVPPLLIKLK